MLVLAFFLLPQIAPAQDPRAGVPGAVPAVRQTGEDVDEDESGFEGFELFSDQEGFSLRFRGKIENDWAFFTADRDVETVTGPQAPFENSTEFRRARFGFSGVMYGLAEFRAIYDFAGGSAGFRDLYVNFPEILPVGSLKIGHFKEPVSLEESTGSSSLAFMERSVATELAPGRNLGAMVYDRILGKRATWAAGVFRETNSSGIGIDRGGGQELALTARVTGLPVYADHGGTLLHLGVSVSFRNPDDGFVRLRTRPESDLAPRIVDTGSLPAGSVLTTGAEAAFVLAPAWIQGEILRTTVRSSGTPERSFTGWSAQAGVLLTGEHHDYSRTRGVVGRVAPADPFSPKGGGFGAVELAARVSNLDLNDGTVLGGEVASASVAANWYLNPNMRFQINYTVSDLQSFGNVHTLAFRFHLDW